MKKGFDAEKYIAVQSAEILKRVARFDRLYLEFGGKLCYDEHAARVLPGYKRTTKVEILKELGDLRIVYCVNARDLEKCGSVGLSGMCYDKKVLKDLKDINFFLSKKIGSRRSVVGGRQKISVVVTRFGGEANAKKFAARLKKKYDVYFHDEIEGYGENIAATLRGYGKQKYVPIDEDLIVVTGPAGGSGKMGFALSQIYYERHASQGNRKSAMGNRKGSGVAKFETFPIWNLAMSHPVNLAYEAATADLGDFNVVDKFHKKAYGKRAVNYNRDVENFGILMGIARGVSGKRWPCGYRSPTDMGVSMGKVGIVDDEVCRRAAVKEIRRRLRRSEKGSVERERLRKILKRI